MNVIYPSITIRQALIRGYNIVWHVICFSLGGVTVVTLVSLKSAKNANSDPSRLPYAITRTLLLKLPARVLTRTTTILCRKRRKMVWEVQGKANILGLGKIVPAL